MRVSRPLLGPPVATAALEDSAPSAAPAAAPAAAPVAAEALAPQNVTSQLIVHNLLVHAKRDFTPGDPLIHHAGGELWLGNVTLQAGSGCKL